MKPFLKYMKLITEVSRFRVKYSPVILAFHERARLIPNEYIPSEENGQRVIATRVSSVR